MSQLSAELNRLPQTELQVYLACFNRPLTLREIADSSDYDELTTLGFLTTLRERGLIIVVGVSGEPTFSSVADDDCRALVVQKVWR
jgi:hypothetical protein